MSAPVSDFRFPTLVLLYGFFVGTILILTVIDDDERPTSGQIVSDRDVSDSEFREFLVQAAERRRALDREILDEGFSGGTFVAEEFVDERIVVRPLSLNLETPPVISKVTSNADVVATPVSSTTQTVRTREVPVTTRAVAQPVPTARPRAIQQRTRQPLSRNDRRLVESANRTAAALAQQARDAFQRGLMPLGDYADQIEAATQLRLTAADISDDPKARVAALQFAAGSMQQAAGALRRFNQPAAEGWLADTKFAELLAVNSQLALAREQGLTGETERLSHVGRQLAAQSFSARLADYREFGVAQLPELSRAASYLASPSGEKLSNVAEADAAQQGLLTEYRNVLRETVSRTRQLAQAGAGLGRSDQLLLAEAELQRAEGFVATAHGNTTAANQAYAASADAAQRAQDEMARYYQAGTADLFALGRAWQFANEVSGRVKSDTPRDTSASAARLSQLNVFAGGMRDRRGRHAADAAFVGSLGQQQALNGIRARQLAEAREDVSASVDTRSEVTSGFAAPAGIGR